MIRNLLLAALFSAMAFAASGCMPAATPMQKVDTWMLSYPPPQPAGTPPIPVVIRVNRFTAAPVYLTRKMVYSEGPHTIDKYHYHQWQAGPGDLATYYLRRDLAASGRFEGILAPESATASTHRIEGCVEAFMERDQKRQWEAVLALSIILVRDDEPDVSRRILMQKTYSAVEPAQEKHPRAVAEAMSRAMARLSHDIIMDIASRLAHR